MVIRKAKQSDLDELARIESLCFPQGQAACKEDFRDRLCSFPDHFMIMCDEYGKVVSFINGFTTDLCDLTDEMYEKAYMHNENGAWQMVFGLCTLPDYRQRGFAQRLLNEFIRAARIQGRKGVVLTCKQQLIRYYEKFGFVNEGVTQNSVIGGVQWYQMRIRL